MLNVQLKKQQKNEKKNKNEWIIIYFPSRTVRADICLDIRKIKDIRVGLSVQLRISVKKHAPMSVAPIPVRISAWISVQRISQTGLNCGYLWLHG